VGLIGIERRELDPAGAQDAGNDLPETTEPGDDHATLVLVDGIEWTIISNRSTSLLAASLLLPVGFFLGGVTYYEGDPGLGILLVPPGAVLLIAALFLIARSTAAARGEDSSPRGG